MRGDQDDPGSSILLVRHSAGESRYDTDLTRRLLTI